MYEGDGRNDLGVLLARADGPRERPVDRTAMAAGALRRVRRRRAARGIRNGVVTACIVLVSGIGMRQWRPRPPARINVAQLHAEMAELDARAAELTLAIARARRAQPAALARSVYDEERGRAAYVLVRSAERCGRAGAEPEVVAAAYRRAALSFPETTWGATAREQLKQ